MNISYISEPMLQFGDNVHICPRQGIYQHNVYDQNLGSKKSNVILGAVGTEANCELLESWLGLSSSFIAAKDGATKHNLFFPFMGFQPKTGFKAKLIHDQSNYRTIRESEIKKILKISDWKERIDEAVKLYFEHITFLATHHNIDVIICVLPSSFENKIMKERKIKADESLETKPDEEAGDEDENEYNFRRALKAKVMTLNKPIQLVLEQSLVNHRGRQDDATQAWNFFTAIYYKANGIPWRLPSNIHKPTTCYVGVSFYRSRDRETIQTSLAQMFDELGNGIILRGQPVEQKEDRRPHLNEAQAHELLSSALKEYYFIMGAFPAKVVLHKSSIFDAAEISGFDSACHDSTISSADYVTILDSDIRLFRDAMYPPLRGSMVKFDDNNYTLMTRGSVPFFQTYAGMYIPMPLDIRLGKHDDSPASICKDILALTKMNWNNTRFDGKYPITLACARKVGEIMKYIPEDQQPHPRYAFYM